MTPHRILIVRPVIVLLIGLMLARFSHVLALLWFAAWAGTWTMGLFMPPFGCLIASDDFTRADETFFSSDSTGNWREGLGSNQATHWKIDTNRLALQTAGTAADTRYPQCEYLPPLTTHVSVTISVKIPSGGKAAIFLLTGRSGLCAKAQIEVSGGSCGVLRLIELNLSVANTETNFAWDVKVPNLAPDVWHRLTICFDPDTGLLSTHVIVDVNGAALTYSHHKKNYPPTGTFTTSGASFWVDEQATGTYYFDDLQVLETKSATNTCPCCELPDCQSESDDFEDGTIDCRWIQTAGSWSESSGVVSTSSANASLTWQGSWSGIDFECLPDQTTYVRANVSSHDYGAKIKLLIGTNYCLLTLESSAGANNATLALSTGQSAAVSGATIDTVLTLTLCYYGDALLATCNGAEVDGLTAESDGVLKAALGTGSGGTTIKFYDVTISHNLFSPDCDDCFADEDAGLSPNGCQDGLFNPRENACLNGLYPKHAVISFPGGVTSLYCQTACTDFFAASYVLSGGQFSGSANSFPDRCDAGHTGPPAQCYGFWNQTGVHGAGCTNDVFGAGYDVQTNFWVWVVEFDDGFYVVGWIRMRTKTSVNTVSFADAYYLSDRIASRPDCRGLAADLHFDCSYLAAGENFFCDLSTITMHVKLG